MAAEPVAARSKVRVAHLTSAHPPYDFRIFHKEARTLAAAGFEVFLVAGHDRAETREGVSVVPVPLPSSRLRRMLLTPLLLLRSVRRLRPDICHLHDPELIPLGLVLKVLGRKVVYDAHENLPVQIFDKPWIAPPLRKFVSQLTRLLLLFACSAFDGVVAASPAVAANLPRNKTTVVVNYPRLDEFVGRGAPYAEREALATYIGVVTTTRGAVEMVDAIHLLPDRLGARLSIAGHVRMSEQGRRRLEAAEDVDYLGVLDRAGVQRLLGSARIGIVVLHPLPNYVESSPGKLFEYMAAGLPVIASHFELWRGIVEEASCGLVVDPRSPSQIADAIQYLLENPQEAEAMGKRGQEAVLRQYNWETEGTRLTELYDTLAGLTGAG
jgi:glycosyltransferase involved in cell wall biosynthesis